MMQTSSTIPGKYSYWPARQKTFTFMLVMAAIISVLVVVPFFMAGFDAIP
jgi:hypothetical protein